MQVEARWQYDCEIYVMMKLNCSPLKLKGGEQVFQVRYSREYDTNLYRVTLLAANQTIVLSRGFLVKRIGMDPRCVIGCKEITIQQVNDLGFIIPVNEIEKAM